MATVALPAEGWVGMLSFSPDGDRLAVDYHSQGESAALLFDAQTGEQLPERPIHYRPQLMTFAAGGELALFGAPEGETAGVSKPGPAGVSLLDGESLGELWSLSLPEIVTGTWCMAGSWKRSTVRPRRSA